MGQHAIEAIIENADKAINDADWDNLSRLYAENAVLVVEPGKTVVGRSEIVDACRAIASDFDENMEIRPNGMTILEAGDTALVLANTLIFSGKEAPYERRATYVFQKHPDDGWLCIIDNSYGSDLVEKTDA